MRNVKSTNTKPEIIVRKYLFANGLRFRLHNKKLVGKPDITLKKYNTIVFVNGCFWHGHSKCKIYTMPKSNVKFWNSKIETNIERDKGNIRELKRLGWKILIIWECELKNSQRFKMLNTLVKKIIS